MAVLNPDCGAEVLSRNSDGMLALLQVLQVIDHLDRVVIDKRASTT